MILNGPLGNGEKKSAITLASVGKAQVGQKNFGMFKKSGNRPILKECIVSLGLQLLFCRRRRLGTEMGQMGQNTHFLSK